MMKTNHKFLIKCFIYTVVISIITVLLTLSTINMIKNKKDSSQNKMEYKKLDDERLSIIFDDFFAYGSGKMNTYFTINLLLKSNLIKEEAKEELVTFLNEQDLSNANCKVYLGVKDNVDIVEILTIKPYKVFTFESNLDYSFKEVIEEFEESSGEKLTKEFVLDSLYDSLLYEETKGIILRFSNNEGLYVAYYQSTINGKIYTIIK